MQRIIVGRQAADTRPARAFRTTGPDFAGPWSALAEGAPVTTNPASTDSADATRAERRRRRGDGAEARDWDWDWDTRQLPAV